ncbi:hypothetical protein F511_04367 [Dorcoceras hygrometricum]|uniref:Uncharacterized protein n=1 Tax=Dorcoceras hygrometricum TaxID=472368 RepID=A0A2Z7BKB5_9LAMI|nr:hypothetical protein F511_04367 [Dorcoceras hygrometricum]
MKKMKHTYTVLSAFLLLVLIGFGNTDCAEAMRLGKAQKLTFGILPKGVPIPPSAPSTRSNVPPYAPPHRNHPYAPVDFQNS